MIQFQTSKYYKMNNMSTDENYGSFFVMKSFTWTCALVLIYDIPISDSYDYDQHTHFKKV